jgi:hypothetical protein
VCNKEVYFWLTKTYILIIISQQEEQAPRAGLRRAAAVLLQDFHKKLFRRIENEF